MKDGQIFVNDDTSKQLNDVILLQCSMELDRNASKENESFLKKH